jgi:hypothetical protein
MVEQKLFAMTNTRPHSSFLASQFAATFACFLDSHALLLPFFEIWLIASTGYFQNSGETFTERPGLF